VLNSAPLLPIYDTVLLAPRVDGVVLVVKVQEVSHFVARQACERLGYVGANILRVVLNGIDLQRPEYTDYRNTYVSYYTSYTLDDEQQGKSHKSTL
jgi:Mrp family chromosome partitioning ATPase